MMYGRCSVFLKRKFRQYFKSLLCVRDISLLKDKNFVIVSNNCWGGSLYQWYKRPYNSPFVGLFLYGPCYLKLLANFEHYMKQKLQFVLESEYPDRPITYPLAKLDDIEVHFTHYDSREEAKLKWERRVSRMQEEQNMDNYYFHICDRERVTKQHLLEFHKLPYKNKISFAIYNHEGLESSNHFKVLQQTKGEKKNVPNGRKLFKLTFLYLDVNKWLLGNQIF